jgi:predicted nucleic acid-binding protein
VSVYYIDTSALVKRYAREPGTQWIEELTDLDSGNEIYTVRLTGPEMIAAIFRKARNRELTRAVANRIAGQFTADWESQYRIVEVTESVGDQAMTLARKHGLRGYDAVHLAAAWELHALRQSLALPALVFISADEQQLEGIAAENPNHYP